jgi:cell wall-associated NlpC family hydrolase
MYHLIDYAKSFIGKPYGWGKEGPFQYDCSGYVQEVLRSVGIDPPSDQTAQALYDHFSNPNSGARLGGRGPGYLCFYGKSVKEIKHVAFMIDNYRVTEAGGGGSNTRTPEDAARDQAMIRMRPYNARGDFVASVKPNYSSIGIV